MIDLMGDDAAKMPDAIKGAALSCILSDTLAFRSPTTTDHDIAVSKQLAADLGIDIAAYSSEMFAAKSDVSRFSDAELLRMDSKEYTVQTIWSKPWPRNPSTRRSPVTRLSCRAS